ncbi:hypothetical protein [Providencia sp.]|uniref:hypothetical protein n=1 Tax=Providencia sp. TaxID=589 RepID=UPI001B56B876|nr:hypothetical protein [Providencia sp.]
MTINYASAATVRKDVSALLKAPRRMPIAQAVKKYMRVPMGEGSSIPWEDTLSNNNY